MILDAFFPEIELDKKEVKSNIKIANKILGCNLEKNIYGTIPYASQSQINDSIENVNNQIINKRIFYKDNRKEVGYIEVFQVPLLKFAHQTNKNISFLFEPHKINEVNININKCFGFRYYDSKNQYCTLLKSDNDNDDDYFFLEKLNTEKNKIFYNEKLDCFQIIYYAIFSRYKNNEEYKKDGDFDFQTISESPLYEILGFNYASQLKNIDKIKFHKIHSLNLVKDGDFTSSIEKKDDKELLNIMPILFNGHISILFFVDINYRRYFILSDPSHIHAKPDCKEYFIFTKNMRENLSVIPKEKIQIFNSCGLWYYLQILIFANYKEDIQSRKYTKTSDFYYSIKNSEIYFDCLKYYEFVMGIKNNLIEISREIIWNESDYFYFCHKDQFMLKYFPDSIKIHKYCFLNQLVDFSSLIILKKQFDLSLKPVIRELIVFRKQNEEFLDFILYLNNNINFLDLSNQKNEIVPMLLRFSENAKIYRKNYIGAVKEYVTELAKINLDKKGLKIDSESRDINLYKLSDKIQQIFEEFKKLKKLVEDNVNLYPINVTGQILFPIIGCLYH